jgi:hypothetical protein
MRKTIGIAAAVLALSGCGAMGGGRQIEVRTGPTVQADVAVHLTNNLTQAVNFYVVSGGSDIFVKQVGSNSTENVPILGVAAGSTVTLKAVTVDGSRTYTRDNIALNGVYEWRVP